MASASLTQPPRSVAIIGAGLGGLTLALSLNRFGINPKLYELRTPDYDFGGAIMLSPNALRILDKLGVYERVKSKGYSFENLTFTKDHTHENTGVYHFGQKEKYGYQALRIYRKDLIAEMRQIVHERGITIEYGRKYTSILSEDENGVRFAFDDGSSETAELLVGADGIHSKVRQYILPDTVPTYSGFLGVTIAIPKSKLRFPEGQKDYPLPATIVGKTGAYVLAPQRPDGEELFSGRQFAYPVKDRSGWDILLKEKSELISMLQSGKEEWSDFVQSGLEAASSPEAHSLSIWPFYTVPEMRTWRSEVGRVLMMGDAAHAIPPTAGQGANQAFEDAFTLAYLVQKLSPGLDLATGADVWRKYRQARIAGILQLNDRMTKMRLLGDKNAPKAEDESKGGIGDWSDLSWLYLANVEEDIESELKKATV